MATIYRQGSSGAEVRRIQQMLARAGYQVTADGVYGQRTADAVKAFQAKMGLKPVDGMVGPVTMARLLAAYAASSPTGVPIIDGRINRHITFCVGRPLKYIAIHYTAGGNSRRGAAMRNRDVFLTRNASADFVVDDETVVQVNPDIRNYYCWAVGDKRNPYGGGRLYGQATNKNTISIEVCSTLRQGTSASVPNHAGWSFSEKVLDLTARLVRQLMKQYGIPKENVIRHYDVTGKACPGIPGWNDAVLYTTDGKQTREKNNSGEWERFKEGL